MLSLLNRIALSLCTIVAAIFGLGAFTFQIAPPLSYLLYAVVALVVLAIWWAGRRRGWAVLAAGVALFSLWYGTIQPENDRIWAEDVSRGVTAEVSGNLVKLHNLRDFDWQDRDQAEARWRDVTLDLGKLETVDLFNSVWASPLIAHTLISFGFEGGEHIVFSAEIRREHGEVFTTYGGLFRQFELVMIAATEEDIIRLRTTARGEDVSLFPLKVTPEQGRELFLAYITRANALAAKPEFYNTLLSNCTTIIWELAHTVDHRLPFDWRVLVSGRLPEYLAARGLLYKEGDMAEIRQDARISEQARADDRRGPDYSDVIRQGAVRKLMPPLPESTPTTSAAAD